MPKRSCKDDNNMELKEIDWGSLHWIDLAQDSDK
jgi:hypothetical protein